MGDRPGSRQRRDLNVVEIGDAVRLGPQRDASGTGESRVRRRVKTAPAEENLEAVALNAQAQLMPGTGRDLGIGPGELRSSATDDTVKSYVVFQRVGPYDVIVVGITQTYGDAACAIDLA